MNFVYNVVSHPSPKSSINDTYKHVSFTLAVVEHVSEQLKNGTAGIVANAVGTLVGTRDGVEVGPAVGIPLGTRDGTTDGELVGLTLGLLDGTELGELEGTLEGEDEGLAVGVTLGQLDGTEFGLDDELELAIDEKDDDRVLE